MKLPKFLACKDDPSLRVSSVISGRDEFMGEAGEVNCVGGVAVKADRLNRKLMRLLTDVNDFAINQMPNLYQKVGFFNEQRVVVFP